MKKAFLSNQDKKSLILQIVTMLPSMVCVLTMIHHLIQIIEFLRWIYCGKVEKLDKNLAIKLVQLADKNVQKNLRDRCLKFLVLRNPENVYRILDVASEQNSHDLWNWGKTFLIENTEKCSLSKLVKYLDRPYRQDFAKGIDELNNRAISEVTSKFGKIFRDDPSNLQLFENFLIESIEFETVEKLAGVLKREHSFSFKSDASKKEKRWRIQDFERATAKLRKALFSFVTENIKEIQKRKILDKLTPAFLGELIEYMSGPWMIAKKSLEQNVVEEEVIELEVREENNIKQEIKEEDIVKQEIKEEEGIQLDVKEEEGVKQEVKEEDVTQEEVKEKDEKAIFSEESEKKILVERNAGSAIEMKRNQKRKKPILEDKPEEKPELKKTKKTSKQK